MSGDEEGEKEVSRPASERDEESSVDDGENDDEDAVETLVEGRAKRATAGNRMSSLVEREGDEDLDLLFAENEEDEDVEFEDEEEGSDAELGSSTDEEDQDQGKENDELAGEKELQQQENAQRKKRKAQDIFKKPGGLRKKVKIDDSTPTVDASPSESGPKPKKKKSERVSWMHSEADAPTRTSSRKQTVKNREIVHKRLLDGEKQRMKVMRQMEEAQKRKEARTAKPMTQAERLEEAAKVERRNAKSLNRWEEAEKKRAEEQKAKLEALHNRQLHGPVITWWSGIARWFQGKITENGIREIRAAGLKEKAVSDMDDTLHNSEQARDSRAAVETRDEKPLDEPPKIDDAVPPNSLGAMQADLRSTQPDGDTATSNASGFLEGIQAYAALPPPQQQPEFTGTAHDDQPSHPSRELIPSVPPLPNLFSTVPPQAPPEPKAPEVEYTSRNLVVLKDIDANASRLPEFQDGVLVAKKKTGKLHKPPITHCAITGQPARFRDPTTGLPYANSYAYGQIQSLQKGGPRWSNLLGCYVGSNQVVARGVPERFWKQS